MMPSPTEPFPPFRIQCKLQLKPFLEKLLSHLLTLIISAPACMSFVFLLLRLKFSFWNSLLQGVVLRQILWIKKSHVRQGKEKFLRVFTGGKSEALCLADSQRSRSWSKPCSKEMKRRPVETWWHLLPMAGMECGNPRKNVGMPGLIKCVSFQDALQAGIFQIYNSLLDYLARTCGNGKMLSLKPLLFSAGWLRLQTPLFKGGELGGQWARKRYLKSEGCTDKSCSSDSMKVRYRPLLSKSSSVCSLNYREETTFAQQWRAVPVALESQEFISKLGNHINLISLFVFLKNR